MPVRFPFFARDGRSPGKLHLFLPFQELNCDLVGQHLQLFLYSPYGSGAHSSLLTASPFSLLCYIFQAFWQQKQKQKQDCISSLDIHPRTPVHSTTFFLCLEFWVGCFNWIGSSIYCAFPASWLPTRCYIHPKQKRADEEEKVLRVL